MRLLLAAVLAIALSVPLVAREPAVPPPPMEAMRTNESIHIDGVLNEAAWHRPGYSMMHQDSPVEGAEASKRTEVWIAYDHDAVYVAARMYDEAPDSIQARLTRRDGWADDDMLWVAFDSFHDKRTGYFFGLSAAGAYSDGVYQNDEWDDDSWDGIWEGKTRIDSAGWVAEFRIPFSQIRYQNEVDQVWGVNVNRYIPRLRESDYITYRPSDGSGFVSRFVELRGLHGLPSPRRIEAIPYLTGKASYLQHDAGDPFHTGPAFERGVGADFKFGLGPNLTLDATVNPDFGQVEIDPAVINLSDQETFFWEKRPFFVEGTNIFRFGNGGANNFQNFAFFDPMFFNSRRIGRAPQGSLPDAYDYADEPSGTRILGSAKLIGKFREDHSLGLVEAVTARTYAQIDSAGNRFDREVEPLTSYTAARVRKEYADGMHSLGIIATGVVRSFSDMRLSNELPGGGYVYGLDGWTSFDSDKSWVLTGYLAGSRLTGTTAAITAAQLNSRHYFGRPDATHIHVDSSATSLDGYTARFWLNKQKGNLLVNAAFGFQTPGLDMNDLGLSFKDDNINGHLVLMYRWTEPGQLIRNASVSAVAFQNMNFGGDNTARGFWLSGNAKFVNYFSVSGNALLDLPASSTTVTRGGPLVMMPRNGYANLNMSADERLPYNINAYGHISTNPNRPLSWGVGTGFSWKVTNSLYVEAGPSFDVNYGDLQYVTTIADSFATATYRNRYVFSRLDQRTIGAGIRVNWTFTPDFSLQCFLQPFISTGSYFDYKELARPNTYAFTTYGRDGGSISRSGDVYTIDPDASGPAPSYQISSPDFSYRSFRVNAVLRWEYLPGSTMYLVWTQNRAATTVTDGLDLGRDNRLLFGAAPDNVFLLKVSYWIHV